MIALLIVVTILGLQEESSEALYSKGVELARSGRPKDALHELEQAARLSPSNPRIHNMLGVVLTQMGRLQEADNAYSKALSLAPDFYPARKNRAVNSFTRGNLQFAAEEFAAMLKTDPKDSVPPLFLGLIAIENRNFPEARRQLLEADKRSPGNFKILLPLIKVSFILGDRATALEQARRLGTGTRIGDAGRFELGVLLAQFAASGEAAEVFRDLWKRQPDSYDVAFNLALSEYRSGRLDEALDVTETYGSRAKLSGEMLNLQGWIFGRMRRLDEAARRFRMATEVEPLNGDNYLDLSNALQSSADVDGAIQVVLKGIERQVDLDRLQVQLGLLYQKKSEVRQAEDCFRKAIARNPENRSAYLASALLLYQTNRKQESLNLLKTSTSVFPRDAFLHYIYGGQLLEEEEAQSSGKLEEALFVLKKALELNPLYANTHFLLGKLYARKGDYASAESCFEKACAFNPRHREALWQLSLIARKQGREDRVAELTQRMQEIREQSEKSESSTLSRAVQDSLGSDAMNAKTRQ